VRKYTNRGATPPSSLAPYTEEKDHRAVLQAVTAFQEREAAREQRLAAVARALLPPPTVLGRCILCSMIHMCVLKCFCKDYLRQTKFRAIVFFLNLWFGLQVMICIDNNANYKLVFDFPCSYSYGFEFTETSRDALMGNLIPNS
jgi:hypothetical protein